MYTALDERYPDAKVIVPPRADAVLSATAETEPTQRDRHIQAIAEKGRMAWQRDSGYNKEPASRASSRAGSRSSGMGCASTATRPAPPRSPSRPKSSTECSTARIRPCRLINSGEWGVLYLFLLRATRCRVDEGLDFTESVP